MGNCSSDDAEKKKGRAPGASLVLDTRCRNISDKFNIVKSLGEGKMGTISCVHKIKATYDRRDRPPPSTLIALKSAKVERNDLHFVKILRKELDIVKELDHPNIIKVFEIYNSSDKNIHACLEFCSGGNLYSHFPEIDGKRCAFSESEAAYIVHQLLSALAHMHASGICHRDIKFENVMMSNSKSRIIKIIDFGAATHFIQGEALSDPIGTVYTMAREVMTGKYNEKADIWSVGVMMYMMLSLTKPFYGKDKKDVAEKIMIGNFKFYSPKWEKMSSSSRNFIKKLISKDPKKRLSALEALDHSWLHQFYCKESRLPNEGVVEAVLNNIESYSECNIVKKVGLNILVQHIPSDDLMDIMKVFDLYNLSRSGILTFSEFSNMVDLPVQDKRRLFESMKIQQHKGICVTEFLAAAVSCNEDLVTDDLIWSAFDFLDHDCQGFIRIQRFIDILGQEFATQLSVYRDIEDTFREGSLNWEEFKKLVRK
jgi:calcium-dependent protein kinase